MSRNPPVVTAVVGVLAPAIALLLGPNFPGVALTLSAAGAGAALALLLVPEMTLLLWLAASIVWGVGVLLLHALLRAAVPFLGVQPFLFGLSVTSLLVGVVSTVVLWRGKWPRVLHGVTRADAIFIFAILPVVFSTLLVARSNGYVVGADGRPEFHARGFVNGDTMTLFALTHSPFFLLHSQFRSPNPFAGNGPLEYPTLLHRALADVLAATSTDVTRAAWWLILPVLLGTVAISVLSAQGIFRRPPVPRWAAALLLAAFGSTWESFTYPQSHTLLTGLFLAVVLLLVLRDQSIRWGERVAHGVVLWLLAVVLLLSNAVLGTAAVAMTVGSALIGLGDQRQRRWERGAAFLAGLGLVGLFLWFPSGEGALGVLNAAYTAVPQFLTAALLGLPVLWAIWDTRWLHRSGGLLGAAVLLPALALVTLVLSGRDLVAENAPRFLFLLVLLGWPTLIPGIQRAAAWWWRQVRYVEATFAELVVLWVAGALTVFTLLLPVAASVVGTWDLLVRKPPRVVSADELTAFAWIRTHTPPEAVFLRAPESQFEDGGVSALSLPAFTGRAQLRSEYWLSPDDAVLATVRQFFRRDGRPPAGATHLFCGPEILACPEIGSTVYAAGRVAIRAL